MERTDIRSRLTVENWDKLPESKLELIGGKLVAGNSLVGSRCLLWTILQSCGPRAALPFAPAALWHQALTKAFSTPTSLAWPGGWQHWATQIDHTPLLHPEGTRFSQRHQHTFGLLMIGIYQALREDKRQPLGLSIQRFVLPPGRGWVSARPPGFPA